MRLFLWPFLLFTLPVFASCGDPASLQVKLNQLKIEAACSSLPSIHECLPLIRSFSGDESSQHDLPQGERCELDLNPLTRPAAKLAKTIAEGRLIHRPREHVNSLEEFFEHTRLHRERVKLLGMELFRTHPELFRGLNATQVRIVLEAHDRAKVAAAARGPGGRPFYQELFQYYGKAAPAPLINELNQADARYLAEAWKHAGIDDNVNMTAQERARRSALRARLKQIEKIADLVDRGKSPVTPEEFGRSVKPASKFLKNTREASLATELERNYARLTVNLDYRPLSLAQAGRLSRQLLLQETFFTAVKRSGVRAISLRAMTYYAIRKSNSAMAGFFEKLASPLGKRLLMAADFIGLYFSSMDQLGCSEIGYHDWVKDPNCRPAIGLTPRVVQFLNEDFATQLDYLNHQPSTCKVITETYRESIRPPVVKSCSARHLSLELGEGNLVRVNLDAHKRIQSVELGTLGKEAKDLFRGTPEKVEISANGSVSKVCYKIIGHETVRTCADAQEKDLTSMNDFMKSINFQIQKAINSCVN